MASPSELSLDCKPHSYSMLFKSFGAEQIDQTTQKLEEFLALLEEERLKIDAFKRELPLCMQLLTNAMEASRQQLQNCRANQGTRPVLEEFIPLKNSGAEGSEKASSMSDKANWMTSAQLWSQASNETKQQSSAITPTKVNDIGFSVCPKLDLDTKRNGGAFLPFSKERCPAMRALPELALSSADKEMEDSKKCLESELGRIENNNSGKGCNGAPTADHQQGKTAAHPSDSQENTTNSTATTTTQTHRKARRCWSPDLHRRFVNALQILGGPQVATPKQIREQMKVDGLTNDEVKSHLQKYRLHRRRPSPSPQPAGAPAPQLVVLGGIWVPSEYAPAAAAAHHHGCAPAIYSAHPTTHASSHYCAPAVPQEFYPLPATAAAAAPPPLQPHHQLHLYNPSSAQTHSSPESDIKGTGDRSESIEDGKSESSGWKADSRGERKALVLREEGEESNGSEITIKF